jgi:hypothetical protein
MADDTGIDADADADDRDREDTPPLTRRIGRRDEDPSPWGAMARMSGQHISERSIAAIRESGRQPDSNVTFADLEVWHRALRMHDESRDARWQRQMHALVNRAPPEAVERMAAELAQAKREIAAAVAAAERESAEVKSALGDAREIRDKVNDHDRDSKFGRKLAWAALGLVVLLVGVVYARGGMDAGTEIRIQVMERRLERIDQQIDRLLRPDRGSALGAPTSPGP